MERTWKNSRSEGLPPGPWSDEPDKVVWVDPATDFDCMIHRSPISALCGYVGVGPDHPLHGCDYQYLEVPLEVHGGLTYAGACQEDAESEAEGLCHVPLPGRPGDVWWFGFDCAHGSDVIPRHQDVLPPELRAPEWCVYRDLAYVRGEVEYLALQLRRISDGSKALYGYLGQG